jgi:hypothetical protein
MPLQASGAIDLTDIQTEFGGSNPIPVGDYIEYRTNGKRNNSVGLRFSDFYDGDGTPPYKVMLTIGNTNYTKTRIIQTTPTPSYYTFPTTKLYGYDNDAGYLDTFAVATPKTPNHATTYTATSYTFGSLGTITRTGTFAAIVVEGLFWSEQFNRVYMMLSDNSDPTFISLTIDGNAYRKSAATNISSSRNEGGLRRIYHWGEGSNPFGTTGTIQIWIT